MTAQQEQRAALEIGDAASGLGWLGLLERGRGQFVMHHEAGHAVVALQLGGTVGSIEMLDPDLDPLERWAVCRSVGMRRDSWLDIASHCLAGPVAEYLSEQGGPVKDEDDYDQINGLEAWLDEREFDSVDEDFENARKYLNLVLDIEEDIEEPHSPEAVAAWSFLACRVYRLVVTYWPSIEQVGAELLRDGSMTGDRLRALVFDLAEGAS
jgi:hypothetical protein